MRGISGTLVILFMAGYVASTVELPRAWSNATSAQVDVADGWRRTAAGWEWDQVWLRPETSFEQPPLAWHIHPFTVAALQVLVSLFALVWTDQATSEAKVGDAKRQLAN